MLLVYFSGFLSLANLAYFFGGVVSLRGPLAYFLLGFVSLRGPKGFFSGHRTPSSPSRTPRAGAEPWRSGQAWSRASRESASKIVLPRPQKEFCTRHVQSDSWRPKMCVAKNLCHSKLFTATLLLNSSPILGLLRKIVPAHLVPRCLWRFAIRSEATKVLDPQTPRPGLPDPRPSARPALQPFFQGGQVGLQASAAASG